jgi:hypothetical protein
VVSPAAGHPDSLCLRMRPSQRRLSLDQHLPRAFSLLTPHAAVPSAPHGASTPMICPLVVGTRGVQLEAAVRNGALVGTLFIFAQSSFYCVGPIEVNGVARENREM